MNTQEIRFEALSIAVACRDHTARNPIPNEEAADMLSDWIGAGQDHVQRIGCLRMASTNRQHGFGPRQILTAAASYLAYVNHRAEPKAAPPRAAKKVTRKKTGGRRS